MWDATPIIVTASGPSSLGPTVDLAQPVYEQRQPARAATAFLIFGEKSSRLFMDGILHVFEHTL